MDEFERRLVAGLSELFADAQPPASLQERILRGVAVRRRRTATLASTAAVLVTATLVAGPVAVVRSQHPTGPAVEPGPQVTASAEPDALDELVDLDAAVRIRRELPEQPPFQVLALGRDGTVLGVPRGGGGESILGTGVWRAGPAGGVPELVVDTSPELSYSLWAVAVGERGYLWPQGEVLACLGPDGEGPVRTFPEGWGGRSGFSAGGEAFVWTESWRRIVVAERCGGPVRTIPVEGEIETFAYPHAYVLSYVRPGLSALRRVDVRTGQVDELGRLESEVVEVAATGNMLAWLIGDVVTIADPRTGTPTQTLEGVPHGSDDLFGQRLSAGAHVVVVSVEHQNFDDAIAIAYDLRNGKRYPLPGQAWTAGDWLLWRDGEDYLLAPIRR